MHNGYKRILLTIGTHVPQNFFFLLLPNVNLHLRTRKTIFCKYLDIIYDNINMEIKQKQKESNRESYIVFNGNLILFGYF